jgi:hypothetical protein
LKHIARLLKRVQLKVKETCANDPQPRQKRGAQARGNPGGGSVSWKDKVSGKAVWIATGLRPSLLTSLKVSAWILRSHFA